MAAVVTFGDLVFLYQRHAAISNEWRVKWHADQDVHKKIDAGMYLFGAKLMDEARAVAESRATKLH